MSVLHCINELAFIYTVLICLQLYHGGKLLFKWQSATLEDNFKRLT